MKVNEIKNEGLELHCEVTVPSDKISSTINLKLQNLAKNLKLPGFRPGKVPFKVVEQKYKAAVVNEAMQAEIESTVSEIIKDKKLKLATQAHIDDLKYEEGKDVKFKVIFERMPEIKVSDFSKIKITKPVVKIKDSEIDDKINELFASRATFKKAAKTAKAELKDKVIIDFEGFVDGVAFEGGKATDFGLVLGSNSFIPGFEDQLVGSKAGDDVTVKVSFPKEYRATELAGKKSEFKVTVHEVQKPEKLEINDEKAKEFGSKDLADLKKTVETMLSRGYEAPAYTYQKMKLFDQLESTLDFDVPASLLKKELDGLKGQISQFKDEDPELKGKSPKELEAYSEKVALRRVRIGLMLADYADKNQLKPTSDDFRSAIMTQARAYPGSEQQIFEFYQNNKQALQSLSGPILEDKAVRHILETQVKTAEKEYTAEAFAKLVEDLED